ncbi:clathrin light chain A-like [Gouania willdenowi]|uniref:clathrin light chain A-like n=1 Tax=Gouania willdenowi TaxID=441366 RepID=UPI001055E714|nr:clathrin light chain A-like [Gouania willdenowi]
MSGRNQEEIGRMVAPGDSVIPSLVQTKSTHINHPCYRLDQAAEEAMISDLDENNPGTEWERVARLCDFNPKSSKQAKDVSRLRSVLISLKQAPLVR